MTLGLRFPPQLFDMLPAQRLYQRMQFSRPLLKPRKRLFTNLELF